MFKRILSVGLPLAVGVAIGWGLAKEDGAAVSAAPAADAGAPAPAAKPAAGVQRYGSVIGLRAEKLDQYVKLHAAAWPDILAMIARCNIRNYSIYLGKLDDGNHYLFSYYEYTGADYAADMKRMADDPRTQEWWKHCIPCQVPQKERKPGEHWMTLREVFHLE